MFKFNFVVDENILAIMLIYDTKRTNHVLSNEFANYLWDKYHMDYITIQRKRVSKDVIDKDILREVKNQNFFKKIVEDAEENAKRIENNLKEKQEGIEEFLSKILKYNNPLSNQTAYILPPYLCYGFSTSRVFPNSFVWGHQRGLKNINYDLVYIYHEALHSLFPVNNLYETVVENIADIELGRFLNCPNNLQDVHDETRLIHAKILPYWNLYLDRSRKEIEETQNYLNVDYDIDKFEPMRDVLKNMNIFEFGKWLENQDLEKQKLVFTYKLL